MSTDRIQASVCFDGLNASPFFPYPTSILEGAVPRKKPPMWHDRGLDAVRIEAVEVEPLSVIELARRAAVGPAGPLERAVLR